MKKEFAEGWIFQINLSGGGVPKHGQSEAVVTIYGLQGDSQANKHVHGGPERALCLYPVELILALQKEGHSVFPGAMGENITLSGIDWSQIAPGTRLRLGIDVVIEATRYTTPCSSLTPYFQNGKIQRVHQDSHPGWSRMYVKVLQEGKIRVGDRVTLVEEEVIMAA